jgi:hypothetical protein
MAACPSCNRPVALARPRCLYCGAPLPPEAVQEAAEGAAAVARAPVPGVGAGQPAGEAAAERSRALLILDLTTPVDTGALARGLGLPLFEAGQRLRRGGYQLQRLEATDAVEAERERLAALGLPVIIVPEAEARRSPLAVIGGGREGQGFRFRSEAGPLQVAGREIFLVVKGPITREYQAAARKRKQVTTATLEAGYRVHLHRRDDLRPVEIDPFGFEFAGGAPLTGSSLMEILGWLEGLPASQDDAFRRETPALAPATNQKTAALKAATLDSSRTSMARRDDAPMVLDNVDQFRFYSGWRAAVERRRHPRG